MNVNKLLQLFLITILLLSSVLQAQDVVKEINAPGISDFSPTLQFLASAQLAGRETGEPGSYIAAGFIASTMQHLGLEPYNKARNATDAELKDYFQTFKLLRFSTSNASVVVNRQKQKRYPLLLIPGVDFTIENTYRNISLESEPVLVGYGINTAEPVYNDYAGKDVKGRIIMIFEGYPGQADTLSQEWKQFRSIAENDGYDLDTKCREAARQGVAAMIVINRNYLLKKKDISPAELTDNQIYQDSEYHLLSDSLLPGIPCFVLSETGSSKLDKMLNINFRSALHPYSKSNTSALSSIKNKVKIELQVLADTLLVHNVIGKLKGNDTTQTIILGAHYDHLGKRNNDIYYGSDDNASGVAGLLALAQMWTKSSAVPPCNIAFASWTAEEKGLIGSRYFASTLTEPAKVKLYINMDMISRSVMEDTARRQLSIGTRTDDEYIRTIAKKSNSVLTHPFELDLWDVTGHSGSDYASFTARDIPIMTYNSGLHNDYHTPRDVPASADLIKMRDVLAVVNRCMIQFLSNTEQRKLAIQP